MPQKIKSIAPYEPLPWQVAPWRDTSPILLLTGSAGGGKSRLAAEKCVGFAKKYPGSTVLVLRKVRSSMANSTLLFLKRKIMGGDTSIVHRPSESRFDFSNGSILAYGGMLNEEQREHIRSIGQDGAVDFVWMEEATQFTLEDFNEVLARMRGKAAPWNQIVLSTNPEGPGHWIRVQLILGEMASVYYSRAEQNPNNPPSYFESLNRLTGLQRKRLVEGKWEAGSGMVFDTWEDDYNAKTRQDEGGNVTISADYVPDGGTVIWSIDDGYAGKKDELTGIFETNSHPRAILLTQLRPNGQIAVFDESFEIKRLGKSHLEDVLAMSDQKGYARPQFVVFDRAAPYIGGVLGELNIDAVFNAMSVDDSIKETREWIAADENGFRRIICHPRCFYLRYQMQTYSYASEGGNIVKDHDDGPDALRYLVYEIAHGAGIVDVVSYSDIMAKIAAEV